MSTSPTWSAKWETGYIVCSGVGLLLAMFAANWVQGFLVKVGRARSRRRQLQLIDFFALPLPVLLTLRLFPSMACFERIAARAQVFWYGFFVAVCIVCWLNAAISLSRVGVRRVWQRGVYLALVVPTLFLGPFGVMCVWLRPIALAARTGVPITAADMTMPATVTVVVLLSIILCLRYTRYLIAEPDGASC